MPIAISNKPHVFTLYTLSPDVRSYAEQFFRLTSPEDEGFEEWREKAEGIMVRSVEVTEEDVAGLVRCRFVGKHGVGVDKIAVKALKAKGVVVMNTAGVNATCVAELALTLIMSVARNVPYIDRTIRSGVTLTKAEAGAVGFQLTGKTLGLVGGGNIGFALGKMWSGAFGGKVLVFDPYLSAPAEEAWCSAVPTFRRVTDLDDLLPEIDVLSVHVPLLDSTQGLIGRDQLRRMKKSAVVINTARGGVIDEDALAEALEAGEITGAGLDAWSEEPPTMDKFSRLINNPRVVSTPHVGAASLDVIDQTARAVVDHLAEAFAGKDPRDVV